MLFNSHEVQFLRLYMGVLLTELKGRRLNENGGVAETVILIAIMAALALAVGAIIYTKFTDKANSIPTG